MMELPENNAGQGDDSAMMPTISPGAALREARERLGLSLADVAGQIKFAPRQIEALENNDFRHLPEMAFVRGFVRNYARILHLDAQPLLESLPQSGPNSLQLLPDSVEMPFPDARSPQRQNLVWLGAALLLAVLAVAFAVWHYTMPVTQSRVVQVETPASLPAEIKITTASNVAEAGVDAPPAPAAPPSRLAAAQPAPKLQPEKPAAQTGASPQSTALRLAFDDESWVEIKDRNGNTLSSQINARGSELRLDGNAPFSLAIGRAASVHLYHRGKPVDLKPYINSSSEVARLTLE